MLTEPDKDAPLPALLLLLVLPVAVLLLLLLLAPLLLLLWLGAAGLTGVIGGGGNRAVAYKSTPRKTTKQKTYCIGRKK